MYRLLARKIYGYRRNKQGVLPMPGWLFTRENWERWMPSLVSGPLRHCYVFGRNAHAWCIQAQRIIYLTPRLPPIPSPVQFPSPYGTFSTLFVFKRYLYSVPGRYQNMTEKTQCKLCRPAMFAENLAEDTSCKSCPEGFSQNKTGSTNCLSW